MIDYRFDADGDYLLAVSDLAYRGGFLYRLVASELPQIENIEPRAMTAGKPTELVAFGRNLGSAAQKSAWSVEGLPLDQFRFSAQAPPDLLALGEYRFLEHPVDHSVLPTAATCTLVGYQVLPPLGEGVRRTTTMLVTGDPVVAEVEPNDQADAAQLLQAPVAVSGRFDRPRDLDFYTFDSGEGGSFAFEVFCERIAGRADPFLIVRDEQGGTVVEGDDYGHQMNAFVGHLRDPVVVADLKPQQKYRVLVGDRYGRGGARLQYVLTIHRSRPDFFVAAIHRHNPNPAGTNIWRGGTEWLDIVVHRTEGHRGPITLTAENLPAGVHAVPTSVQDGSRGTFVLWSDADAPIGVQPIRLTATGERQGEMLKRTVRPYSRVWPIANIGTSRPTARAARGDVRVGAVCRRDRTGTDQRQGRAAGSAESGRPARLARRSERNQAGGARLSGQFPAGRDGASRRGDGSGAEYQCASRHAARGLHDGRAMPVASPLLARAECDRQAGEPDDLCQPAADDHGAAAGKALSAKLAATSPPAGAGRCGYFCRSNSNGAFLPSLTSAVKSLSAIVR